MKFLLIVRFFIFAISELKMSNKLILCISCKADMTSVSPDLPCRQCNFETIDGVKVRVNKDCIHYPQYISCNKCLWGDGGKIIYLHK